jgi:cephalosporin hydroxylase
MDLRISHNPRDFLVKNPVCPCLKIFVGSSLDQQVGVVIGAKAKMCERVMVILDSNHTHEHVLGEPNLYASLVSVGNYCVVIDTVIEDLDGVEFVGRPLGKGNNPKTAVAEFLKTNSDFVVDQAIDEKLLISVAPGGYFKRIK